jgi:6-phosphofructokinase 1
MTPQAIETYQKHHLDALVCIGGRETQDTGRMLSEKGLNIITLPKAIDNDIQMTDLTIGFNTAMEIAAEAIDRLHSTALSSHRIIIVEMMGRHTGWLTLGAGLSSGADVILIPEIPFNIQKIADAVIQRCDAGKNFSIVAVSERVTSQERVAFQERLHQINAQKRTGREKELVDAQLVDTENKHSDSTYHVANRLNEYTGLETRITILGYLLRGGSPSARDRFLATLMGTACVDFIREGRFGVMVAYRDGNVVTVPLVEVDSRHKLLPENHPWIESARRVGTVFGD